MKKSNGFTLVEVILALFINVMVIMLIASTFQVVSKAYMKSSTSLIASHEALMFIDYYINNIGESFYIKDEKIYIVSDLEKKCDYITKRENEICIFYMNSGTQGTGGVSYTYQPILYNVKSFIVSEKNEVLFIKIITKDNLEVKKTIGKH